MKIVFFADLHYGAYKEFNKDDRRIHRTLQALETVFLTAKRIGAGAVIDCGDLINQKNNIDFAVYNLFVRFLSQFQELQLFLSIGNHNTVSKTENNLMPLSAFQHVRIMPQDQVGHVFLKEGVHFCFIPYCSPQEWYIRYKEACEQAVQHDSKRRILVAHAEIKGAIANNVHCASEGIDVSDLPGPFDFAIFGHYHRAQVIKPCVFYCGALLQQEFGEEGNPQGFWVFDTDDGHFVYERIQTEEFVTVSSPQQASELQFARVQVSDEKVFDSLQATPNMRVELLPPEVTMSRLDCSFDSLDEAINAYVNAKVTPELHPLVMALVETLKMER